MSELQRCSELLADLHNRVAQLERGQATAPTALRPLDTTSHAGTSWQATTASFINQPLSQSSTTAVSSVPSPSQHMTASNRPFVGVTAGAAALGGTPTRTQAELEHQRVFGYMPRSVTQGATSRRKASGRGQQPSAKKRKYKPTWTRVFVCLASTSDDRMPSPSYYRELKKASLGERNITFNLSDNSVEFDFKLKMEFPKLEMAGGYVLMCSHSTSRVLEELKPPYNVQRLKRETGQCKIFIRPLRSDLDLTPDADEEEKEVKLLLTQCPFLPLLPSYWPLK